MPNWLRPLHAFERSRQRTFESVDQNHGCAMKKTNARSRARYDLGLMAADVTCFMNTLTATSARVSAHRIKPGGPVSSPNSFNNKASSARLDNRPILRRFGNRHFCDFSLNTACCERLLQLKDSAAYNLTVDIDVDAIGTDSQCDRAQIVYVLTTIN